MMAGSERSGPEHGHASGVLGVFPIRTVASLTGVSAFTLRAWERRYGLVQPMRTAKGRRVYSQEDVERIRHILGLLDAGMAIGQVSGMLGTVPGVTKVSGAADFWSGLIRRMAEKVSAFDEQGLEATYQEALALHPVDQVTEHLLLPLLDELGARWRGSQCAIAEEHFFSLYLRNKLGARFHHRRPLDRGLRLLCASLPGERHEAGQLLFALAAHDRGFRTILLGADVPWDAVAAAARRVVPDGVILSGSVGPSDDRWSDGLKGLVAILNVPVMVGGPVSLTHRRKILEAGAQVLGRDLNRAFLRIRQALDRI